MRKIKREGGFWVCLLLNMLLNLEWSIPAWVLLGLHVWAGVRLRWFAGALGFWILCLLLGMWIMGWAADCGSRSDPPKENKNPYSVKGTEKS